MKQDVVEKEKPPNRERYGIIWGRYIERLIRAVG